MTDSCGKRRRRIPLELCSSEFGASPRKAVISCMYLSIFKNDGRQFLSLFVDETLAPQNQLCITADSEGLAGLVFPQEFSELIDHLIIEIFRRHTLTEENSVE